MSDLATKAIADGISLLLALLGIGSMAELLNYLMGIAGVIWIIRKICGFDGHKRKKNSDNWLYKAQKKQEIRFQNALPPLKPTEKKQKITIVQERNEKKGLSSTGWRFNEETQLWEPPQHLSKEAKTRWIWDEKKQIWIDKQKKT